MKLRAFYQFLVIIKIAARLKYYSKLPPFEAIEYIYRKISSSFVRRYFAAAGAGFYLSRGSRIRGHHRISIGVNFYAGEGLWLECVEVHGTDRFDSKITIGNNVSVSRNVHIAAVDEIIIGNNVLLGSQIIVTDHNHGCYGAAGHSSPHQSPHERSLKARKVAIGDNVWIGDGCVILPGVMIGMGSVVAANSVITMDIPKMTIVAGNPGRVIKIYCEKSRQWKRAR